MMMTSFVVMLITMMVVVMTAIVVPLMADAAKVHAMMMTVLSEGTLDRTQNKYSYYKGHHEHRSSGKELFHIFSFFWNI